VAKIFISYRRGDSASSALGVAQYLAREFGSKNIFIDVDMSAGANFPATLEKRLAECKVLLALIGPRWLSARDDEGRRRLENPNDWVRLEIARALLRQIPVIPVRIDGAQLPRGTDLPEDIRDLVNSQAAVVTTEGFRNEMAGLVRDIRAIQNPLPWKRIAAFTAGALVLIVCGWAILSHIDISGERTLAPQREIKRTFTPLRGTISFRSERGDYIGQGANWTATDADGEITAAVEDNSVSINFHGDDSWDLEFVAPKGKRIEVGSYDAATRAPFNSPTKPGLSISGAGRGCNTLNGRFNVRQIAYSKGGDGVDRLAVDFEQHCDGAKPALSGSIEVTAIGG
jgi:hypothetical protein